MFSYSERGLVSKYLVKGIAIFDFVLGHKSLEISLKFSQPRLLTTKQKCGVLQGVLGDHEIPVVPSNF